MSCAYAERGAGGGGKDTIDARPRDIDVGEELLINHQLSDGVYLHSISIAPCWWRWWRLHVHLGHAIYLRHLSLDICTSAPN